MQLGAFSVSLAVKDIAASRAFYEKLGFAAVGGEIAQNWLILRNGATTIGLFQNMFERNILTFNPGWDTYLNGASQVLLYVSGLGGTFLILIQVFRAYRQRQKLQRTIAVVRVASETI